MDTFFEFIYYIGILTIVSLLNTKEPAYAADLNDSQVIVQTYQSNRNLPLKKAGDLARRFSECE